MIVLVTGCAGFIGSRVVEKLLRKKNYFIIGIDNLNNYYDKSLKLLRLNSFIKNKNFKFYKTDIRNKEINKIIQVYKPSHILHLAAQPGVRYSIEKPAVYINNNISGFLNLLEGSKNIDIKNFLFASSSSVYGNKNKVPFLEKQITDYPENMYAVTKKTNELMAECYSNLYSIPFTGIRYFTVYGPMGRPDMAPFIFANKILERSKLKLFNSGNMYRDFTYVDDAATGTISLLNRKSILSKGNLFDIYNIGNSNTIKVSTFLKYLSQELNEEVFIENLPMQHGDMIKTYANITKIYKETGFKPKTDIKTGIKKFAKWFKAYKKIKM